MALIRTGTGIIDIRGGCGGVYFHRDKSGLHTCRKPRNIQRRSAAQNAQRKAFAKARAYSTDPRTVSYLIYRALNNLPFILDAIVTENPNPDCTGKYLLISEYNEENLYQRTDSAWHIWYKIENNTWNISIEPDVLPPALWIGNDTIEGKYEGQKAEYGNAWIKLQVQPPPLDFKPAWMYGGH